MSSVLKDDANRGGGGGGGGDRERKDVLTVKAATPASDSKYYKHTRQGLFVMYNRKQTMRQKVFSGMNHYITIP